MHERITKDLFNLLLVEAIKEAKFKKITIEKKDDGVGVEVSGETFGIIGALTAGIHSVSHASGLPVEIVLQMINSYSDCLAIEQIKEAGKTEEKDLSSLLDLFGKYVEKVKEKNEEGEN